MNDRQSLDDVLDRCHSAEPHHDGREAQIGAAATRHAAASVIAELEIDGRVASELASRFMGRALIDPIRNLDDEIAPTLFCRANASMASIISRGRESGRGRCINLSQYFILFHSP